MSRPGRCGVLAPGREVRRGALARLALAALCAWQAAPPAAAQEPARPGFRLAVPPDLVVTPPQGYPFIVVTPSEARVVASVALSSAPDSAVWRTDTLVSNGAIHVEWSLRDAASRWVPDGRYRLHVSVLDSGGVAAADRELDVVRLRADTAPLPAPPDRSELLPETVQVRQTSPWAILIGTAAGVLPHLVGRHELNDDARGDTRAWIVVGAVTVVGFVAIFAGHRPEFSPENAQANAQLTAEYRDRLLEAQTANALAREAAGFRVRAAAGP